MRGLSLALVLLVVFATVPTASTTVGTTGDRTTVTEPYLFFEGTLTSDRFLGCSDALNLGGGCVAIPSDAEHVGPVRVEDDSGLRVPWALRFIDRFGQYTLLHTDCGDWFGTVIVPEDARHVEIAIEDPATGMVNCLTERTGVSYPATTGTFSVTFR